MDDDAEVYHILGQLLDAGLAETHTDSEGRRVIRLTPDGERLAHKLAMLDEAGQEALLAGLLDEAEG